MTNIALVAIRSRKRHTDRGFGFFTHFQLEGGSPCLTRLAGWRRQPRVTSACRGEDSWTAWGEPPALVTAGALGGLSFSPGKTQAGGGCKCCYYANGSIRTTNNRCPKLSFGSSGSPLTRRRFNHVVGHVPGPPVIDIGAVEYQRQDLIGRLAQNGQWWEANSDGSSSFSNSLFTTWNRDLGGRAHRRLQRRWS